jgi:hypothetical protein
MKAGTGDSSIVDLNQASADGVHKVGRKLVPGVPRGQVRIDEDAESFGGHRLLRDARRHDGDERLCPEQLKVQALIGRRGPSDRGIETAVEHARDLNVTGRSFQT